MTRHGCDTCRNTGTHTRDSAYVVCHCPAGLRVHLTDMPALVVDLETTLSRQTATGDRVGARGSEVPLPFDGQAGRALLELRKMLVGWVNELLPTHPHLGPACRRDCGHESCAQLGRDRVDDASITGLSGWLLGLFPRLAEWVHVDELTADVVEHVTTAREVIDRPPDRVYLGPCDTPGCVELWSQRRTQLYALPDASTVACPHCGMSYDVDDRKATLRAALPDRLASATEISRALTSLDEPVTPERIRKWAERGRVTPRGLDPDKHPTYRIGDVQELLAESERARAAKASKPANGSRRSA